jgi:tetratricopeptide (TPR) repeat protein
MIGRHLIPYSFFLFAALCSGGCATTTPPPPADPLLAARQRLVADPGDVRTLLDLAELYMHSGDYLRARQYLTLAERLGARALPAGVDGNRVFRLGILIAVQGHQYTDAIRRCQQHLGRAAEDAKVRGLLASLLEATGDELGAERQWRMLILLHPEEGHYLLELARFYGRTSRADRQLLARRLYARYLEVAPQGNEAAQARAAILEIQSDSFTGPE